MFMEKIHVLVVHGGMTFKNEKDYLHYLKTKSISIEKKSHWAPDWLEKNLGRKFQVITPRMPLPERAEYRDWKMMFERYLPLLNDRFVLIGSSLGGVFLAKYLSENTLKRKALATYLVCPPFDNTLPGEDLVGGFNLGSDLSRINKNSEKLHLFFSQDDDVVPVAHAEKYRKALSSAQITIYKSKHGHFKISTFPEIVKAIKTDT